MAGGTRLGPFEVGAPLGAGGMGEVYRARDTRLNRDVAIKILPDAFALDADRLARFKREAQVLAALNHQHIAAIYGLEETDGVQALVLELVEGPTLADRITDGPLALDEALPIARQIAEALEAAHEQGIIHRDLKPANIKLRKDGSVKVLDFGLAKLASADQSGSGMAGLSMSPTITTPAATGIGMILGTAAYMPPEQARGKAIDKRADIWAFGCVLYEMLTGQRAFPGEDMTETIAAVVKGEPDWSALPTDLPPTLRLFLRRCLVKNPADRLHDIGDMRLALEGVFDGAAASPEARGHAALARRSLAPAVALGLIILSGGTAWMLKPAPSERAAPTRRFAVDPAPMRLAIATTNRDLTITRDGTRVIYLSVSPLDRQLYSRELNALTATAVRTGDRFYEPFVSPDGKWIGFNDESGYVLKKVSIAGGPPVAIAPVGREILGATWGPDDTIVFATTEPGTGLWRVPAGGGTPARLTTPDQTKGETSHRWPEFLPGARAIVFTVRSGQRGSEFQIAALDLQSGEYKIVVPAGTNPQYSATGHLVYGLGGTLRAVRFDPERLELLGDPVSVVEGVFSKPSGAVDFATAVDGTLVYVGSAANSIQRRLVWVDRNGAREAIDTPPRAYTWARLSPDGSKIAIDVRDQESDVWIWDFSRRTLTRLTNDPAVDGLPAWTPDGRRIAFISLRRGPSNLYWQPADGTGAAESLTNAVNGMMTSQVSPDGSSVLLREETASAGHDLMILRFADRRLVPLVQTTFNERNGEISPDGRWLAYQSDESGTYEVYVRPFPRVQDGRWQVSTGGGAQPVWARNGRELFYATIQNQIMSVPVGTGTTFIAGSPRAVVSGEYFLGSGDRSYDVSPDGKRFLMIEPVTAAAGDVNMVVVLNWAEELKRLLPDEP